MINIANTSKAINKLEDAEIGSVYEILYPVRDDYKSKVKTYDLDHKESPFYKLKEGVDFKFEKWVDGDKDFAHLRVLSKKAARQWGDRGFVLANELSIVH